MSMALDEIRDRQRETWDKFSAGWKKWDAHMVPWLAPFGDAMIATARLRQDSVVLDVAGGTGEPGLTIAAQVPRGKVTVTDLSGGMLAVATETAARRGLRNVETMQCDAAALPYGDNTFDAVTCRFGFMFFPDVNACLRELVRVAKPGGRICAAVWSSPARNPWASMILEAILGGVDISVPSPDVPGLFRCGAPGYMRKAFGDAGLTQVKEREIISDMHFATADQYWSFMTDVAAPVVAGLSTLDEAGRARIRAAVLERVERLSSRGTIRLRATALTLYGEKPASKGR